MQLFNARTLSSSAFFIPGGQLMNISTSILPYRKAISHPLFLLWCQTLSTQKSGFEMWHHGPLVNSSLKSQPLDLAVSKCPQARTKDSILLDPEDPFAFDNQSFFNYFILLDFAPDLLLGHVCKFLSNCLSPFLAFIWIGVVPSPLKSSWFNQFYEHNSMPLWLIMT